jgi:plasmid maintenance system antidote protein VapI
MLKKDVQIGQIIHKVFRERKKNGKITAIQFAKELGRDRTRIYALFKSKSIDSDMLVTVSNVLDYNLPGR